MTACTFAEIPPWLAAEFDTSKQEAKNCLSWPKSPGCTAREFLGDVACPNSHLDLQEVLLVATYTVLCVWGDKDNEILYVGFEVVVHVPCHLSEVLMLLFFCIIPLWLFYLIVLFPSGLFKWTLNFELWSSLCKFFLFFFCVLNFWGSTQPRSFLTAKFPRFLRWASNSVGCSLHVIKIDITGACLREMGTPNLRTLIPHIPSDMGTGGGHITRDMEPWGVPWTLVIWGFFSDLGTPKVCVVYTIGKDM